MREYTQIQVDIFVIISFIGGLLIGLLICWLSDRQNDRDIERAIKEIQESAKQSDSE